MSNKSGTILSDIQTLRRDITLMRRKVAFVILLHEKFLLRAVVFQLNLKYLHVKITNLLRVVV